MKKVIIKLLTTWQSAQTINTTTELEEIDKVASADNNIGIQWLFKKPKFYYNLHNFLKINIWKNLSRTFNSRYVWLFSFQKYIFNLEDFEMKLQKSKKDKSKRIRNRWQGYFAEDYNCMYCLNWRGKRLGCLLPVCGYIEEKNDAAINRRIKQWKEIEVWNL